MTSPTARRNLFALLVLVTTLSMVWVVKTQLATDGLTGGEITLIAFYGLLLAWISSGFWLFVIGAVARVAARSTPAPRLQAPRGESRTAIVIPIYHEDVDNVFDRVRVIYRSLERTGCLSMFEFFVLSDSRDAETGRAELRAWQRACEDLAASGRLFYRRRVDNRGRKSGNIEEFCRRWGGRYTYMVVLDADSLIAGRTLVSMVARMEASPRLGLLQTWPVSIGGQSIFSRLQQFAGSLYGRLLMAGLHWLQSSAGTYWGHNAIIRMQAFADSCALPSLPGRKPLGGEILSHDFVEAALLVRAGWEVRLAPDLGGSYEEGVPSLTEHARRDRRWCQGNLQHWRLLFARRLHAMSRMTFAIGIMSYLSGPLWLTFVTLAILTFPGEFRGWFWPEAMQNRLPGIIVLGATLTLLIGPKLVGFAVGLADRKTRQEHGGGFALTASVLIEMVFSALVAPLLAVLHTRFVASILSGHDSGWGPPLRGNAEIGWRVAFAGHWVEMAVGLGFAGLAATVAPGLFWWLLPITLPLTLAVPITVLSSRASLGGGFRRAGLLVTPAEVRQIPEIDELAQIGAWRGEPLALPRATMDAPMGGPTRSAEPVPLPSGQRG